MNKRKAQKLMLNTETLRLLTLKEASGAVFTAFNCTHFPCPISNDTACPSDCPC